MSIREFEVESKGPRGAQFRRDFNKWVESHHEAMFDRKDDVAIFTK